MNTTHNLQRHLVLLIASCSLTAKVALADEIPSAAAPEKTVIVMAKAETQRSAVRQESDREETDPALAEALEALMADNKLELDLRLSGHKSEPIAADR